MTDEKFPSNKVESMDSNCRWARDNIGASIDGELTPTELEGLEKHLELCSECDRHAGELRQDWSLFESALLTTFSRPSDDSEAFLTAVRQRVADGITDEVRGRSFIRVASWAAAAVALFAVTLTIVWRPSTEDPTGEDREILSRLPSLVELQREAGDLESVAELKSLIDELIAGDTNGSGSRDGPDTGGESMDFLEILFDEELEGSSL